ncbi:sigma-70 family RNA polymerase sigma factor [Micromonospora sp. NPDC005413]|uniref:RNA polymerase sigma factor n=1 Tax=Micromonospora sp. NPDC005413 TaxID=3154563 RepID=UPI00339ED6F3
MDDKTTERTEPQTQRGNAPPPDGPLIEASFRAEIDPVLNMPLDALAEALSERDRVREEFSAFYREFMTRLGGWLLLHGWASEADAFDIAQETMRLAYEKWTTIEHPKAWARRTASRLCVKRLAKGEMLPVEDIEDRIPRKDGSDFAASDTLQDFMAALQQLPPRQRQMLLWAYEEYEPAEIAAELNVTPEAVRSSLWKARRKLATIMQAHGPDDQ